MDDPKIVVLGGGVGGVVAANELHGKLKEKAQITIVERSVKQSFAPSYLWVMTGERKPDSISRDISHLDRKDIEVVAGEIERIDTGKKSVTVSGREIAYDYLIVALGAELDYESVPGFASAHTFYQLDGAEKLRRELKTLKGGRVSIVIASTTYKCPAAPYEAAMLLEGYFHSRHTRHNMELAIYTPEPAPMPVGGPTLGEGLQEMLAHKGIEFHGEQQITAIKDGELQFEDGSTAPVDVPIVVPPHRAPAVVKDSGLTDKTGWVPVDKTTLETKHEGVFAIGDVTYIPLGDGMMLPKAGVFAHGQAEVVARNIAYQILGHAKREKYDGTGYCFLEAGGGVAGMAQGNFFAEPRHISMRSPSPVWHWGKVAYERYWLWKWY
ncbi:MAG: NAD(P)/FAD-dependent oxidoreductase [Chloroflexi bacterium]|nr:NAD(P)/FAD-dependent oxidoreductase [Chloroflexota bacterium]